jgi:hypothetical protein
MTTPATRTTVVCLALPINSAKALDAVDLPSHRPSPGCSELQPERESQLEHIFQSDWCDRRRWADRGVADDAAAALVLLAAALLASVYRPFVPRASNRRRSCVRHDDSIRLRQVEGIVSTLEGGGADVSAAT